MLGSGENKGLCILCTLLFMPSLICCHLVFLSQAVLFVLYEKPLLLSVCVFWLVRLLVRLQLLLEFNLTALRQIQIYGWEKRQDLNRAWPPLPSNSRARPSFTVHTPSGVPALITISSLWSFLVNSSSHSSNHNQCKACLKVFTVVNVVNVLMGGIKSGGQIKYPLRISYDAYTKLLRDDIMVLEMSLSFIVLPKCGFIDKTKQTMCLSTESVILWI